LLTITDKPQWYVIKGGSRSYLPALTNPFKENIKLNATIEKVYRYENNVLLKMQDGEKQDYDHVIFACHSDQALRLLGDASKEETDILSEIRYEENSVVLHRDTSLLPKNKRTWSSWNYLNGGADNALPTLTYNMNILQGLSSAHTFCVSLNADSMIDEDKILASFRYSHPQFSLGAYHAQKRKSEICGVNRTSYCGAYWANGFHEDGVVSALDALEKLGVATSL
jgi:predicted NAD/FAD-binding protein